LVNIEFVVRDLRFRICCPKPIGGAFRPLALMAVAEYLFILVIGVQPPGRDALWILDGPVALMVAIWHRFERRRFRGLLSLPGVLIPP
jgi:hypothetical protein